MTPETLEITAGDTSAPEIRCAYCDKLFVPSRSWSSFCSTEHQRKFANMAKTRGGPLVPLVLAWTATRHAKPDTEEAEICNFARQQITEIARMFIDEDVEEKRSSAVNYVRGLMKSGFLYVDRRR